MHRPSQQHLPAQAQKRMKINTGEVGSQKDTLNYNARETQKSRQNLVNKCCRDNTWLNETVTAMIIFSAVVRLGTSSLRMHIADCWYPSPSALYFVFRSLPISISTLRAVCCPLLLNISSICARRACPPLSIYDLNGPHRASHTFCS